MEIFQLEIGAVIAPGKTQQHFKLFVTFGLLYITIKIPYIVKLFLFKHPGNFEFF